jgi:CRP/FNR family transcriptional regulator
MPRTDTVSEAAQALAGVPSFAGLDPATRAAVARAAVRQIYAANQVVFLEGEPAAGLYVVQEGWLKAIKISPAGREQTLRVVGPGETFNEISVLAGSANLATVVALEPATLWVIPSETMLHLLEQQPRLAREVIQHLAARVQHLIALVEDLSLRTVEARLARLLLEQAADGVISRRRWSTQAELAARLGTVPDVLNRALRSLIEAGHVQVERHQIRILDQAGLEMIALAG